MAQSFCSIKEYLPNKFTLCKEMCVVTYNYYWYNKSNLLSNLNQVRVILNKHILPLFNV